MGLLEMLHIRKRASLVETPAEQLTVENLLASLSASKNVGDAAAGSGFLNRLTDVLNGVKGNSFAVIPNIPSHNNPNHYTRGVRISSISESYDGRAVYDATTGNVNFNLKFRKGATDEVRNSVGAAVYPLFDLIYTPPKRENPPEHYTAQ